LERKKERGDFMARPCSICSHLNREEIDRALIEGKSLSEIVSLFPAITKSALHRHKESHLPQMLAQAKEAREVAQGDTLLSQVRSLQNKALSILKRAEEAGELRTALQGVREARACLELLGKTSGQLPPEKILIQFEPIVTQIVLILRQEVRDPETLKRISDRLLIEAGSGEGGVIGV
jgi:hypothetical protein